MTSEWVVDRITKEGKRRRQRLVGVRMMRMRLFDTAEEIRSCDCGGRLATRTHFSFCVVEDSSSLSCSHRQQQKASALLTYYHPRKSPSCVYLLPYSKDSRDSTKGLLCAFGVWHWCRRVCQRFSCIVTHIKRTHRPAGNAFTRFSPSWHVFW